MDYSGVSYKDLPQSHSTVEAGTLKAWKLMNQYEKSNTYYDYIPALGQARSFRQALAPVPYVVQVPYGSPSISFLKDHQLYRLTGGIPGSVVIPARPPLRFLEPFPKLQRCSLHTTFHSDSLQLERPKPGPDV